MFKDFYRIRSKHLPELLLDRRLWYVKQRLRKPVACLERGKKICAPIVFGGSSRETRSRSVAPAHIVDDSGHQLITENGFVQMAAVRSCEETTPACQVLTGPS